MFICYVSWLTSHSSSFPGPGRDVDARTADEEVFLISLNVKGTRKKDITV